MLGAYSFGALRTDSLCHAQEGGRLNKRKE
jgi:hypothetical protein